jgi:hypothetical protein
MLFQSYCSSRYAVPSGIIAPSSDFARHNWAEETLALFRMALFRMPPARLAPSRLAHSRLVNCRLASLRLDLCRLAPCRLAFCRLAPNRMALFIGLCRQRPDSYGARTDTRTAEAAHTRFLQHDSGRAAGCGRLTACPARRGGRAEPLADDPRPRSQTQKPVRVLAHHRVAHHPRLGQHPCPEAYTCPRRAVLQQQARGRLWRSHD